MADIFPSHQETHARKIKASQFSWIETACTDNCSCWNLRQEILTANQGWAGRWLCLSCTVLKYKTMEFLMRLDTPVNIYLGTFM